MLAFNLHIYIICGARHALERRHTMISIAGIGDFPCAALVIADGHFRSCNIADAVVVVHIVGSADAHIGTFI